jgi:hypothetical protein
VRRWHSIFNIFGGRLQFIAFHVSNRSIDLRPVVEALACEYQLASPEIYPPDVSDWILLSADPAVLGLSALPATGHPIALTHPGIAMDGRPQ